MTEAPFVPIERTSFDAEISRNKLKSYVLGAIVFGIIVALVYVFAEVYTGAGSAVFLLIGLLFSGIYVLGSYYYGDKIVLSTTGAKPLDLRNPRHVFLKNTVENLAFAARLPKAPDVYIIQSPELNAFATGRDPEHASVAVTSALLEKLDRSEIEGVIAHEISHVSNYDIRFSLIVAVMVGLIAILSHMFLRSLFFSGGSDRKGGAGIFIIVGILLAIFAPIIVRMVQASVSRKRELLADASGARITRNPEALASALEKLKNTNKGDMKVSEAESHLFFADPVKSHLDGLFATHPPIDERIKILRGM
ncbi:MAG: M48 family metallopeptidase [Candidatus Micrarchaeota archaeon]|nr:M48 family metallopeptidase [Candidatus Micrarchaeota archaeon]